ncbi:formate-dependent phosphoribosylglycinamide formyltransferase [Corallincola spongiicola]|uniref:Formate-dependent phosphoribosylglycinamide formyltransferase n=1 Tax=Corallincola spongiicola TaxID=2520508 RepID=A0ABY1WVB9_9GAMM|nr:formate-dependent phosphoribosylglycinamide formyltransferase [Corallincola spongiicola]TAA48687.1 formate-dependent phosphoribosylglycinamide formyltransferase [Corallincola spongiicola]
MIGTPGASHATKALLLGSGELGKEVVIELQRLGVETIATDRYADAPAMQVAHRSYVIDMLDGDALRAIVEKEQPDYIIPEIEAIATDTLIALEQEGVKVVPNARTTQLTMNREGIRRLAAEELQIPTSPYRFADTQEELTAGVAAVGMPCVIKPIMSSSGKGQSVIRQTSDIADAWQYAQEGGRAGGGRVIVEGFVDFDYEITLLTVLASDGVHFCDPIGHRQEDGDYRESWQPQQMSQTALTAAQAVAEKVVKALGGFGLYGVELFVKGDQVLFSEVSPRPHDTGMVTLISQDLSEFALHVRAILGLPIGEISHRGPSASAVLLPEGNSRDLIFGNLTNALAVPTAQLRLFGKQELAGTRRMGVALARGESIEQALTRATEVASAVSVTFADA